MNEQDAALPPRDIKITYFRRESDPLPLEEMKDYTKRWHKYMESENLGKRRMTEFEKSIHRQCIRKSPDKQQLEFDKKELTITFEVKTSANVDQATSNFFKSHQYRLEGIIPILCVYDGVVVPKELTQWVYGLEILAEISSAYFKSRIKSGLTAFAIYDSFGQVRNKVCLGRVPGPGIFDTVPIQDAKPSDEIQDRVFSNLVNRKDDDGFEETKVTRRGRK